MSAIVRIDTLCGAPIEPLAHMLQDFPTVMSVVPNKENSSQHTLFVVGKANIAEITYVIEAFGYHVDDLANNGEMTIDD